MLQDPWITWIIQTITMLGVGVLGFFIKQTFKQSEARMEKLEKRIDALEAKHERLPYDFTTNETYIRTFTALEKKLDKIYDKQCEK